jgi:putative phage-type endonuclease
VNAILLGQLEPNTSEWDEIRSRGIGGSEIAAVVGLSPWVSRFALWHRKRGTLGKQDVNAGMNWGHRLESVICDAWSEKRDMLDVERAGTYCHPDRRWQLANVDRLLYDDEFRPNPVGLLEVKTAHQYDAHEWGPDGSDEIPPYYRCQVLWYMDVLGVPEAHLAVLIGGSDYREYVIPYSADEAGWLREQGEQFWREVQAGIPPAIDAHDATYEAVRKMHPDINGEDVVIPNQVYAEYATTKKAADKAAAEHKRAKSTLLDLMGDARRALITADDDTIPVLRRQPGRGGSVSLQPIPQAKTKETAA